MAAVFDYSSGTMGFFAKLSLQDQAKFVDIVIHRAVTNQDCQFISSQLDWEQKQLDDAFFFQWNICSIGNLAYIALHYPDPDIQARAKKYLDLFLDWYRAKFETVTQ